MRYTMQCKVQYMSAVQAVLLCHGHNTSPRCGAKQHCGLARLG
jgi:hypothetical protein